MSSLGKSAGTVGGLRAEAAQTPSPLRAQFFLPLLRTAASRPLQRGVGGRPALPVDCRSPSGCPRLPCPQRLTPRDRHNLQERWRRVRSRHASLKVFPPSEPPPWGSACHWQYLRMENQLLIKTESQSHREFEGDRGENGNPWQWSQPQTSREAGHLKEGQKAVSDHSPRTGVWGLGGIYMLPLLCTKSKRTNQTKAKNCQAAPWHCYFFWVIQPYASRGYPLVWECWTLEMNHKG